MTGKRKLRVFFLTSIPPIPTWGGAMAYYRHFVEREDVEIFVVTDDPNVINHQLPYRYILIRPPRWLVRLSNTRLYLWVHSFRHLAAGAYIPQEVKKAALDFQPDLILTASGTWNWLAMMAQKLARKCRVPVVGSFMDWYDYNLLSHPLLKPLIKATYLKHYRQVDLALCTSEGMREALGPHKNALIHYPTGAYFKQPPDSQIRPEANYLRLGFAGNLGEWYGGMLERLVSESEKRRASFQFLFFGNNAHWSAGFDKRAKETGIFRGQVPFEKLTEEFKDIDLLILPMGFEANSRHIESTSFKTKFLDYLSFGKPILVWGPDYCSAVRVAREFDSAECCVSPEASACCDLIERLSKDPSRRRQLVENAIHMYQDRFHPDAIHKNFTEALHRLVSRHGH